MANISLEDVTKRFSDGTVAVDSLTLEIEDGEFMVLVGPSGSGKSTALRMVAGLEEINDGLVRIGSRIVNDMAPKDRDIAMVFQNYALYPHMTVYKNMEFALKLNKTPKEERAAKVNEAVKMLGIGDLLERRPRALSGGQRQRVAMGRAIVREPQAFLMDEPLSNLDAKLRVQMRAEIARVHQRLTTTTIYVTHDQTEAMTMGDRVAVMRNGGLQQVDTPEALYDRPANLFVAGFIGSPAMNLVHAGLETEGDQLFVEFGGQRLVIPEQSPHSQLRDYIGRDVILGIRPESLQDARFVADIDYDTVLHAKLVLAEPMGAEIVAYFNVNALAAVPGDTPSESNETSDQDGDTIVGSALFTARLDPKSPSREKDALMLVADVTRLYFFDPETEAAIS